MMIARSCSFVLRLRRGSPTFKTICLAAVVASLTLGMAVAQDKGDKGDKTGDKTDTKDPTKKDPAAAKERDPEAIAAYDEGKKALDEEKFEEALAAFRKALGKDQGYSDAYIGLGRTLFGLEDYKSAVQIFGELAATPDTMSNDETAADILYRRALAYIELGDVRLAVEDLQAAASRNRKNKRIYGSLGRALAAGGSFKEAQKNLDKAIEMDKENDYAEPYYDRGLINAQSGELRKARDDVKKALSIGLKGRETKKEKDYYLTLAQIERQLENYPGSVEAFGKVITLDKENAHDWHTLRGNEKILQGNHAANDEEAKKLYESALADCDEAIKLKPELAQAIQTRGMALRHLERTDEAIEAFGLAIKYNPEYHQAFFHRGIIWFRRGELGLAALDMDEAARISVVDAKPLLWRGLIFAKQRKWHDAVNTYSTAIRLSPMYVEAYHNRALAYMGLENYEKAIDDFNEVIRTEPKNATAFYRRGVAESHAARDDDALISYTAAIALKSDYAEAYFNRAIVHDRLKQPDKAEADRKKARELKPDLK